MAQRRCAAVLPVLLALLLGACGDDPPTAPEPTPTPRPAPTPQPTPEPAPQPPTCEVYDEASSARFLEAVRSLAVVTIDFEDVDTSHGAVVVTGEEYAGQGITFLQLAPQPLKVEPPYAFYPRSAFLSVGNRPYDNLPPGDTTDDSLRIVIPGGARALGWTFFDVQNPQGSIAVRDAAGSVLYSRDSLPLLSTPGLTGFFGIRCGTAVVVQVEIIDRGDGDDLGYDDVLLAH